MMMLHSHRINEYYFIIFFLEISPSRNVMISDVAKKNNVSILIGHLYKIRRKDIRYHDASF